MLNPRLVHDNEKSLYIFCLLFSIVVYVSLIISIIGIIYIIAGIIAALFVQGLMMGHIRANGIKITEQQFPSFYHTAHRIGKEMGLSRLPDIFVLQSDGMLNAFATRFMGRNYVVLYSNLFELIETGDEEELSFILAHEFAHIKRNHISKNLLILPALWFPFLGKAYSRGCEFTCDRIAAAYIGNAPAAIQGLVILAIGRTLYKHVNISDYVLESSKERGFFVWLSHIVSTHPPLPVRISKIENMHLYPQHYGYTSKSFEASVQS
ncbi:peptidase M48 [Paenibacillus swuensis]|uniref:Peptidase M48 n=1 Tax=Paenibacillus swuensis TaxID=1178515 RepID=A0A172TIL2_9BACL|nr:M48 family metallopeptidase [Paenibacillus swuensis]ANE46881.1 peptidase M48 [Paenibacillus swuensis]